MVSCVCRAHLPRNLRTATVELEQTGRRYVNDRKEKVGDVIGIALRRQRVTETTRRDDQKVFPGSQERRMESRAGLTDL